MKKVTYIVSDIDKALSFEWIVEKLDKQKYCLSFILINRKESELERFLEKHSIPYVFLSYKKKTDLLRVFWKVVLKLKKDSPDIVHCHLFYGCLIGLVGAKIAGIKKRLFTRHHSDFHHRYFPQAIKWDKWCNRLSTTIIAPSQVVQNILVKKENVPPEKIKIIHHGFDINYFRYVDEERIERLWSKFNLQDGWPILGVISRFTELKGIQFIIPAFKNFLESYPEAVLMLFNATGDYESEIETMLNDLLPKNYVLIPFENDIAAVYHLFDIFLQVSIEQEIEAFGQTYVESLIAGIPSIFTLAGIASDFVKDRYNALVVPFKDSNAIYNSMLEIMTDKNLSASLIDNGIKSTIEKFSLAVMIAQLEMTYDQ